MASLSRPCSSDLPPPLDTFRRLSCAILLRLPNTDGYSSTTLHYQVAPDGTPAHVADLRVRVRGTARMSYVSSTEVAVALRASTMLIDNSLCGY